MRIQWIAVLGLSVMGATAVLAQTAKLPWPADATVFFVEPKDGAEVSSPFKVVMGVKGIEIAPAGADKPNTGHHHILIDTDLPAGDQAEYPLPADDNHKHFGKAQTETELKLPPGKHTLQLVVGDGNHIPHSPALASEKISVTVK